MDKVLLNKLEQEQWDIRLNFLSKALKNTEKPFDSSKYHPPCSKGVYDCDSCERPDKAQCKKDLIEK